MEKFYCESIIPFIKNKSQFYLALHFFESIIFNLIKRREALGKKNMNMMREITDSNDIIINEIENLELSEENIKLAESEKKIEFELNHIENDDKTVSYSPEIDKTETLVNNPSENNSEKKNKNNNDHKDKSENGKNNNPNKESKIQKKFDNFKTSFNNLKRKKRNAIPKDLTMTDWSDTCYICLGNGEMICCDGCTNAAHLFCAYLEVK